MHFIFHFLTFIAFSVGFMLFFTINIKYWKHFVMLLLFVSGMAIGAYMHVAYQDQWEYDKDIYKSLVVDVQPREMNPWRQVVCLIIKNSNTLCPDKDDPRWQDPGYFGDD